MDMYQLYLLQALYSINILVLLVIVSEAVFTKTMAFFCIFCVIVERSLYLVSLFLLFTNIDSDLTPLEVLNYTSIHVDRLSLMRKFNFEQPSR